MKRDNKTVIAPVERFASLIPDGNPTTREIVPAFKDCRRFVRIADYAMKERTANRKKKQNL